MDSWRIDLGKGAVKYSVVAREALQLLARADGEPMHVWAMLRMLDRSHTGVYKALERMENAGLVVSTKEEENERKLGRRRRRYYVLTDLGRAVQQAIAPVEHTRPGKE